MSLTTRIARLFKADAHAILDCLEEPETILKQSVREMEAIIEQGEARSKRLEHQQEALNRRQVRLNHQREEIERHIDLCFAERNDSLARASIRKKLETGHQIDAVADQHRAVGDRQAELRASLEAQKEQLQDILDRLDWLTEEKQHDQASTCADRPEPTGSRAAVSEEMVELAFLQEKRRRASKRDDRPEHLS